MVPYLAQLGISDIYASPILKATPGSTHGYDVTNPDELNPELGTWEDFRALTAEVKGHQMGWLQDIVPNHMAYSSANWMLMDVFENGPRSMFWDFFDIFRDHPDPELRTKVLAPFLGDPLEEVLQRGEMRLTLDRDGFAIRYFNWRFPLYLASYDDVLRPARERLSGSLARDDARLQTFVGLPDTFARLSEMDDSARKRRELAEAKEQLARLYSDDPMINAYVDGLLKVFNRRPQGPVEQSPLYLLLERQIFKPVFWQVAYEKINYRRFFYLSDFISLRVEDPKVFHRTHAKILELTQAGAITGLRVDHIDGLYNPREYLARLHTEAPDTYLVVEKILELGEFLRTDWPIQGTSGYKFCNYVNGIFCRRESEEALTTTYHEFIGSKLDYGQRLYDEKKKILETRMGGEVAYLAHLAVQASPGDGARTAESLHRALTALMAAFPAYRTYVDAHHWTEQDRTLLTEAVEKAKEKCPECRPDVDYIVGLLLSVLQKDTEPALLPARQHFFMRFQQFTGPAMAKGFEDTLLYVYNRFISLNEVGGDPGTFGLSLDRFHRFNQLRARDWPHAMNATSTHDSKRGEDVRARLNVLSEIPDRWQQAVTRWARMNEPHKQRLAGAKVPKRDAARLGSADHDSPLLAPDRNDEYLLYQTLVGALPFDCGLTSDTQSSDLSFEEFKRRIKDYMVKAVREAKTHGDWVQPSEPYENAGRQFIDRLMDRSRANRFWPDFLAFQREVSEYGICNSLAQTTLKMTCPGVPDFYQGSELWNLNLVDPDNRRPVDFEKRMRFLQEIQRTPAAAQEQFVDALLASRHDGRVKLFLIYRGLQARRENKDLFEQGDYLPASVAGSRASHVVSFFRAGQGRFALVVVPRFVTSLVQPGQLPVGRHVWEDTRIGLPAHAPSNWQDAITGRPLRAQGEIPVADILATFPVSILFG